MRDVKPPVDHGFPNLEDCGKNLLAPLPQAIVDKETRVKLASAKFTKANRKGRPKAKKPKFCPNCSRQSCKDAKASKP